MSLSNLLVPTYQQMLQALSNWLKKAQEQSSEAEALLSARLAADMFPLATQVRFACVQVYEAVSRLTGEALPDVVNDLLTEGRNAGDQPGSLDDAQARINETIAMLESLAADALDTDSNEAIEHALPNGMIFDLTAEQYARDWTLAQFYFHIMAAYCILRKENIEIGKADYVAHMFPYLRPETVPGNQP